MMTLTIVTHYEEGNLGGDYLSVDVVVDGKTIAQFGDQYHDNGRERADGFIEGVKWASKQKIKVVRTEVEDTI